MVRNSSKSCSTILRKPSMTYGRAITSKRAGMASTKRSLYSFSIISSNFSAATRISGDSKPVMRIFVTSLTLNSILVIFYCGETSKGTRMSVGITYRSKLISTKARTSLKLTMASMASCIQVRMCWVRRNEPSSRSLKRS